ncbi:efflux RND transporter permease subunit [Kordiimonas sp. SCSIO 12610]|uniref:efflux RND transporter permease subunit n=1 Tax=Kordiimonas sp. SCSIO 12610 TaxID=2829597 RepID=UPI00210A1E57|nr:efflux RND transporter permease subunit [Kordiimonas sp. SCSIO 12610]UTW56803.1 efflux RND transporter permease subunit [Kordiimonas sp. SCSIO 12610]
MLLSDVSVKRPVFATVLSLLLIAFGLISFQELSVRELPDVDPPVVSIQTNYPGANAAIVETRITQIVEGSIAGVPGIKTIDSTSSDGRSNVNIEFTLERDIDAAANDVRDRVSRILNNLPEEVDPPEVSKADGDTRPIMFFVLTSPVMDLLQLTDFAERNIVDRVSVVDGVAGVRIFGRQRYAIRIHLDRQAMAARGVAVADIERALRAENIELPAGRIESIKRDTIVRVNREYTQPQEFNEIVIREDSDGNFVRLGDVGRVELGAEREQTQFRGNGVPVIGIGIVKQSTANTLSVAQGAKAEIEKIKQTLPESMTIETSFDSSIFIEKAIDEVYFTLAVAMGLVVLVLYLFLGNLKTVLVPAVTVPVCIIASFWVLNLAGVSINLITLLALVLAIGLVVDDAIVVLENIYRRVEEGEPGLVAAYRGAKQVGFAVIATTLVLIGVFVPISFLSGNIGRIFGELAVTMTAAIAFSSLVALSLSPMMCSILVRRRNKKPEFSKKLDRGFTRLQDGYGRLLEVCIDNKLLISACFLVFFVLIYGIQSKIPQELAPTEDRSSFIMRVQGPQGASFEFMREQALIAEQQVLPLVESGEVERVLLRVDGSGGFGFVILPPWEERERSAGEIANELRGKFSQNVPGMRVIPFQRSGLGQRGGGSEAFQFVIGGDTYDDLGRYKQVMLEELGNYPGLVNVDADYRETQPQFNVKIDRKRASDIGVSIQTIGSTLETMMGGRRVTTFERGGEEYDVILQAEKEDRQQPLDMTNIHVTSSVTGQLIPLSNLVTVEEVSGAGALRRFNRVRALTISGNVAPGYTLGQVIADVEQMTRDAIPDVTTIDYKGATREFLEAGDDIYFIFALALVVVFLILAAQFESFIHPFVIMLTVPLAVFGGLLGLYMWGSTLNIYSQLGMIMLIGLAAKNGILIVEFANQLRDEGMDVRTALMDASKTRLRPIMMTGISTAIGALPLMLASGAGSASRQTIGVVVFGGVIVATFFTLFIVPVFYDMLAKYTKSPGHVASQLEDFEEKEKAGVPAE